MKLYRVCAKLTDEKYSVDIRGYEVSEYDKWLYFHQGARR